jgi:hypothetical protein
LIIFGTDYISIWVWCSVGNIGAPQECVGGDVDIVAGITKLGEQVAENTKLELQ